MTDLKFTIDKNVPMPSGRYRPSMYPFANMMVGDSFLYPCQPDERESVKRRLVKSAEYHRRRTGARFSVRFEDKGVRCWRVANKGE